MAAGVKARASTRGAAPATIGSQRPDGYLTERDSGSADRDGQRAACGQEGHRGSRPLVETVGHAAHAHRGLASDKTCDDLEACCAMLSGTEKTTCDIAFMQFSGLGDAACGAAYSAFAALGCP